MDISNIELPTNRKFGWFFTTIFIIISAYFFIHQSEEVGFFFSVLSIIFLIITVTKADVLHPLNKLWMKFGILIGKFVSPIILGIVFFGLFTPTSLIMRLIGRDELRLKLKARNTYWRAKDSTSLLANISDKQY